LPCALCVPLALLGIVLLSALPSGAPGDESPPVDPGVVDDLGVGAADRSSGL